MRKPPPFLFRIPGPGPPSRKRYPAEASGVTATVVRIGPLDLERRQTPQLLDVLPGIPGVLAVREGGAGYRPGGSPRGGPIHALVLLHGIPMDHAAGSSAFNFSGFTAAAVDSVEVPRGNQGLMYGPEAMGGAVSIRARR